MNPIRTSSAQRKVLLSVGFLALSAAVLSAYTTPARGYEVSIYTGTPLLFWLGFGLSLLIGTWVALHATSKRLQGIALGLGGASMLTFVSLPLIRGYFFIASADTMSHLGWVRDIATGTIDPVQLIYPGIHVLAVLIHDVSNFGLPRSLMFVTILFPLLYFCFVGLGVRMFTDDGVGTVIGVTSALLLLPINVIVVKLFAHPISQAILYTSVVFFLLFWYLTGEADRLSSNIPLTGVGALFLLALGTLVLYHPLSAAFVLLVFGTISIVQLVFRRGFDSEPVQAVRTLYVPTAFLAVCLGVWMVGVQPGLSDQAMRIFVRITGFFQGNSAAGEVVSQRQSSIRDVGATLWGLFVKLFLISTIYVLLTLGVMLGSFAGWFENQRREVTTTIKLVTAGLLVAFSWALMQFIGDISNLFFRYVGSMMVIGTIFGAVGLYHLFAEQRTLPGLQSLTGRLPRLATLGSASRTALFALFAVALVFATAFNYPSPGMYLPSGHMTEADFDGHETIFRLNDTEYELSSIGYGVPRYRNALEGTTGPGRNGDRVPVPEYNHDLVGYVTNESLGDGRYLILSDRMRTRRVVAYRGLRYNRSDFRAVESEIGVNRPFDNGAVRLYLHTDSQNDSVRSRAGAG